MEGEKDRYCSRLRARDPCDAPNLEANILWVRRKPGEKDVQPFWNHDAATRLKKNGVLFITTCTDTSGLRSRDALVVGLVNNPSAFFFVES
jgi:hypothetical protein